MSDNTWRERLEDIAQRNAQPEEPQHDWDERAIARRVQALCHVPERYIGAALEHIDRKTVRGADWLWTPPLPDEHDMFVFGGNGSGKTYLAAAIAREWGAYWTYAPDIIRRIRASFGKRGGDETENAIVSDIVARRVIVIDDITAISTTEHGLSTMLAIISERGDWLRPTIVTSFLSLAEINKLDSSLASRLAAYEPVKRLGVDRRIRK